MKILSIVGARPQFIKAAMISKRLREKGIEEILIHTGQHYDFNMSDIFFKELHLVKPDYYLGIGSSTHGEQTGKMLIELEKRLLKEKPNIVLVYGDTNTTLAGTLATAKLHIPFAHVEAGLRSYNKKMPEEINRIVTDHCSDILFCPTETAVKNLQKEGFTNIVNKGALIDKDFNSLFSTDFSSPVLNVGDVMLDMACEIKSKVNEKEIVEKYKVKPKEFILATIHRAENTDNKSNLENIWNALTEISRKGIKVIFPIHPRTKKALKQCRLLQKERSKNLRITEPLGYIEMIGLESNAKVIITDSGGVQKEGYFFKIPCIILRNETEWVELVDAGWNTVVGTKNEAILEEGMRAYNEDIHGKRWIDFYGNGEAGKRIVEVLENFGG